MGWHVAESPVMIVGLRFHSVEVRKDCFAEWGQQALDWHGESNGNQQVVD